MEFLVDALILACKGWVPAKEKRSGFDNLEEKLNDPNWEPTKTKVNPLLYFVPKGMNVGGSFMPIVSGKANSKRYSGKNFGISAVRMFELEEVDRRNFFFLQRWRLFGSQFLRRVFSEKELE